MEAGGASEPSPKYSGDNLDRAKSPVIGRRQPSSLAWGGQCQERSSKGRTWWGGQ